MSVGETRRIMANSPYGIEQMTNAEYFEILSPKIEELQRLRGTGKSIAAGIIGQSLLKEDLFFCAATDRCMQLIGGFISMLQNRNLTCAGALLRLQLDNCMRSYSAFIAEDKEKVINCIIYGERIDKQKSQDGNLLKDVYLKNELSKLDPGFSVVYDNTSGYIHFSDRAFYQTVKSCDNGVIEWGIGTELLEKFNPLLIEAADGFIHFVKLHYRILSAVVESKERFDKEYQE